MDETYFLYSEKGKRNITERKPREREGKAKYRGISYDQVCELVARARQKTTCSGVLGRGCIRTAKLDETIGGHLSDSNVLCTDSRRIQFLCKFKRLGSWMDRFNGVATKYLHIIWLGFVL